MRYFRPIRFPFLPTFSKLGIIPTDYKIALSYEEQLLWLCSQIQSLSENITLVDTKVETLRAYVDEALSLIRQAVNDLSLDVQDKQDKLIAGMNIEINGNIISARFLDEEDYTPDITPDYIVPLDTYEVGDTVNRVAIESVGDGYLEVPNCDEYDRLKITGNFILAVLDDENVMLEKYEDSGEGKIYTLQNSGRLIISFTDIKDHIKSVTDDYMYPFIQETDVGSMVASLVPASFDDVACSRFDVVAGNKLQIKGKYELDVLDSSNFVLEKADGENGEYIVENSGTLYINFDLTNNTHKEVKVINPLKPKVWRTVDIVALLDSKQDKLIAGDNITLTPSDEGVVISATGGSQGTTDYDDLDDKPTINSVTLQGNKTAHELRLASIDDYEYLYGLQPYKTHVIGSLSSTDSIEGKVRSFQFEGKYSQGEDPSTLNPQTIYTCTGEYRIAFWYQSGGEQVIKFIDLGDLELLGLPFEDDIDYIFPVMMIGGTVSWYLQKATGKIASYNGESVTTTYISSTGGLDTGATVYYQLDNPTVTEITSSNYPELLAQLNDLLNFETKARTYSNILNSVDQELVTDDRPTPTASYEYYLDMNKLFDTKQNKLTSSNAGDGIDITNGVISQIAKSIAQINLQTNATVAVTSTTWATVPMASKNAEVGDTFTVDTTNHIIKCNKDNVYCLAVGDVAFANISSSRKYRGTLKLIQASDSSEIDMCQTNKKGNTEEQCRLTFNSLMLLNKDDTVTIGIQGDSSQNYTVNAWNCQLTLIEL